jgi:hypothetical protein
MFSNSSVATGHLRLSQATCSERFPLEVLLRDWVPREQPQIADHEHAHEHVNVHVNVLVDVHVHVDVIGFFTRPGAEACVAFLPAPIPPGQKASSDTHQSECIKGRG